MRCEKCGATSQKSKRFCADCGAALCVALPSERIPRSGVDSGSALPDEPVHRERRHLTVLFGDLVNSTRLAAERDPEEWRDIVTACLEMAGQAIATPVGTSLGTWGTACSPISGGRTQAKMTRSVQFGLA